MTNSYRVAEPAACDSCEDFGLTYDLVSSESVLISKSVANSTSHLNHLATTIESAIRIMSRWEKEGVLHTDKDGFVVLDRAVLEDASAT